MPCSTLKSKNYIINSRLRLNDPQIYKNEYGLFSVTPGRPPIYMYWPEQYQERKSEQGATELQEERPNWDRQLADFAKLYATGVQYPKKRAFRIQYFSVEYICFQGSLIIAAFHLHQDSTLGSPCSWLQRGIWKPVMRSLFLTSPQSTLFQKEADVERMGHSLLLLLQMQIWKLNINNGTQDTIFCVNSSERFGNIDAGKGLVYHLAPAKAFECFTSMSTNSLAKNMSQFLMCQVTM